MRIAICKFPNLLYNKKVCDSEVYILDIERNGEYEGN